MKNIVLLLPIFLLFASGAYGQIGNNEKITDEFNNVKLSEFFSRLEKKVPYKFYYDAVQLDSFTIQLNVKDKTLPEVLQEAFKGTDLRFSVDNGSKSIYITRKLLIA